MARTSRKFTIALITYCFLAHVATFAEGTLHAQQSAKLHSGDRVRVTMPGASPTTRIATLLAVRGDSLLLQTEQPLQQFAVVNASPALLEVSRNPSAPKGAGVAGGFAGLAVGGLVAQLIMSRAHSAGKCPDGFCSEGAYLTALGSVIAGTITGVVIGRGRARERWDAVTLPATVVDVP